MCVVAQLIVDNWKSKRNEDTYFITFVGGLFLTACGHVLHEEVYQIFPIFQLESFDVKVSKDKLKFSSLLF